MIDYLFTSIYFLTIFLTGFVVVSVIFNGKPRSALETLSSSMLIGAGAVSTIFFWFSLVGVPPTVPLTSALLLASSVAILVFARYGGIRAPTPFSRVAKSEIPFLAAAAIVAAYFFCIILADALLMPLYSIDSFALWCLKAKALFHEGLYGGFFHQPSLSYSHLNYPLSVPFLISGIYVSLGRFDDCLGKLIFPFFYLAGMIFIYSSLRWKLNRAAALCLTLVFISHPVLIRWSAVGIADVPLTMFYAGSVFYLVKFLAEEDPRDCLLSFLFSFFCAFTKNEGMAIAAINVGVLACFYLSPRFTLKKAKTVFAYGFGLPVLLIPWFYWRAGIPATHLEEVSSRYKELWDLKSVGRIGEILSLYLKSFVNLNIWGLLWIALPAVLILNFRVLKEKYALAMWALLSAQIAVYFSAFIISPWSPDFLAGMALERILLHTTPAVVYLIAFHINGRHIHS